MKLSCLLNQATEILTQSQIPTPRLDAEVLMSHLLGIDRVQLYTQTDRKILQSETVHFKKWIERRSAGEPVSYIRGLKEFWSLPFKVGPGVMIPRPDTEVLIEAVLSKIPPSPLCQRGVGGDLHILDIGTGSGNIAIALAKEFSNSKIIAIDISEDGLDYARQNAKTNGVGGQIDFLKCDFLTGDKQLATSHYDLIVSNPPYIPSSVIETLDPGIRNFEPRLALNGGPDGLDFYRRMGDTFPSLSKPGGMAAVEIGEDQASQVVEIFERAGLSDIEVVKDYAGLPRVILGKRESGLF